MVKSMKSCVIIEEIKGEKEDVFCSMFPKVFKTYKATLYRKELVIMLHCVGN